MGLSKSYIIATIVCLNELQETVPFPCIHDHAPYLAHPLKLDNLQPVCKVPPESTLHHIYCNRKLVRRVRFEVPDQAVRIGLWTYLMFNREQILCSIIALLL